MGNSVITWIKSLTIRSWAVFFASMAVFVIPLININWLNYGITIPKIMTLCILSSVLIFLLNIDRSSLKKRTVLSLLTALFIFSLLSSTITSEAPLSSIFGNYGRFHSLFFYLFSIAFFYIGSWLADSRKIIIATAVTAGGIAGIIGIIDFWHGATRIISTLGHPLLVANYLILLIPLILGFIFTEERKMIKILSLLALFLTMLGIVLSFSRAGWAALVVAYIIFFISAGKRDLNHKGIIAGILLTIILTLVTSVGLFHFQPKQTLIKSNRLEVMNKIDSRPLIWKGAWQEFIHEPFGTGLSTFPYKAAKYLPNGIADNFETNIMDQAHNEFLQILANQGILGGIIFLLIIGALLYQWIKWRRDKNRNLALTGIWTAVFAHLFVIQFSFVDINYTYIFWFLVGVLSYEAFPEKRKLAFSMDIKLPLKITFSIGLILLGLTYSSLLYLADANYSKWLMKKNFSFWQRNCYIERANSLAFWETYYRYHRAVVAQKMFAKDKLTRDQRIKLGHFLAKDNEILLRSNPIDFKYYQLTAETLIIFGNYQGAIKSYHDALNLFPNNYYFLCRIGEIYTALGESKEANAYYRQALNLKSGYNRAVKGLKNLHPIRVGTGSK